MTSFINVNQIEPTAETGDTSFVSSSDQGFLRAMFDSIPGRTVVVDLDAVYRYVNQEFLDFVGKTGEQVIGRNVSEVLGPEVEAAYGPVRERVLAGEALRWERWAEYPGYGRRYVQEAVTPWKDEQGAVRGVILIARDLTDLKSRESELEALVNAQAAAEAYGAAIMRTALDGIVVIDGEGVVVEYNPAAETMFGYARREAIGRRIADLIVPEEFRGVHEKGMARYMATGQSAVLGRRLELEALHADGSRFPVELHIADVTRGDERLFAAHLRDLRVQRAAAAEIERQREALYQKEKLAALGSLLAGVAHELNNPLAIVLGQATLLREILEETEAKDLDPKSLAARCGRIETAATRSGRILKNFLAMARQKKGERQPVDLERLLHDVVELLGYNLRSSDVAIETVFGCCVPKVVADRDQLYQVIANLIVNAHQALDETRRDDKKIKITIGREPDKELVVIAVEDNGPGVPPDIRNRIFEPFFTTKPEGFGTGIGLAISRGLILAHGGALDLESRDGPGSRFVIRLPASTVPTFAPEAAHESKPAPTARRRTVLVIDDEADIRDLLADLLERQGFDCRAAAGGRQAMALISEGRIEPAAILCDIRMPNGDGPYVHQWLTENRSDLVRRLAFLTGDALSPSAAGLLAASGVPVLEKPFRGNELSHLLSTVIEV
ncbi:PAS domain S-box protein [Rhizobium sp. FKL33]|uniref:hybrid sensor histidine kinase/response regulator n=1 Tax=Rhizobium sp. FKL33 TaxID=2562307 RepID=UPI001FED3FD9|nr:PAS domain S-box protein [Rhizobium sp. FKL33]